MGACGSESPASVAGVGQPHLAEARGPGLPDGLVIASEVALEIHALAAGGDGVARAADGRVVFVPFTAPGDRVRVRLVEEKPRFARGEALDWQAYGPGRAEPRCPAFGECGGCSWQHLDYETQLAAKARILQDALVRIGGLDVRNVPFVSFVPSPDPYHYRGRTRLWVEGGRVGYRRRGSHALCAVSSCPVLVPELDAKLGQLAADPGPDGERELGVFAGSPGVFHQSNALLVEPLVDAVVTAAGEGALAFELFAGAGLFTRGLVERFERVVAVESSRAAVADLRASMTGRDGQARLEVLTRRVESPATLRALSRIGTPDVVVLDPPRSGLARGAAEALAGLGAPRLVYLSCDPATLARDLRVLCGQGYALGGVRGFDLFPQTAHVEALVVLERTQG